MIRWTYFFFVSLLIWELCEWAFELEIPTQQKFSTKVYLYIFLFRWFIQRDCYRSRSLYLFDLVLYIFLSTFCCCVHLVSFVCAFFFACSLLWFFSFDILVWSYLVAYLRQEFRVFHRTITVVFRCFFLLFIHRIFLSLYIVVVARSARIQFVCFFFALCWLNSWMYCVMCKYNKMSKSQ